MLRSILLIFFTSLFIYASCKKQLENDFKEGDKGSLELSFRNKVGDQDLVMNTASYKNAVGEEFTVTLFNYYISNIVLHTKDGHTYQLPKDSSYFLIRGEDSSHSIQLKNIPAGNYSALSFTLGVDSLKSASPVEERKGVLDPAGVGAGMYWSWHSGYIFVKMEGVSKVATSSDKKYRYHIGGFGGYSKPMFNNIKQIRLELPEGKLVRVRSASKKSPQVQIYADAARVMNGPMNISIAAKTTVMVHPFSVNIANNYASMFQLHDVLYSKK